MASLYQRGKSWSIQFEDRDGVRRYFSLGKLPKRDAQAIKYRVEQLIAAQLTGHAPDAETSRWLATASDALVAKLSNVGLTKSRRTGLLGAHIDAYLELCEADPKIKASTVGSTKPSYKNLKAFFGKDKPLRDITKADAVRWRISISEGRAENTTRKWIANAKKLFNAAIAEELIEKNPFTGIPSQPVENRDRDYFVTVEEAAKVLAQCPDVNWRLIFGLPRFGGLRCPTEVLALQWSDILWDQNRFIVRSSKTEHHDGHAMRFVPLWPEVRALLEEAYELAPEGATHVVRRRKGTGNNLRTRMAHIIEQAGIEPWPKLFHNLRATRSTEVANEHGESKEAKWIGHSRKIARKHYLLITDEDYSKASQSACNSKVLQKVLQNPSAAACIASHGTEDAENAAVGATRSTRGGCGSVQPEAGSHETVQKDRPKGGKWVYEDSNFGPQPYQGCALTN